MDRREARGNIGRMEDAPTFRQLMLEALGQTGMSIAELSRRTGVSYDVINKLKRRENASTAAENAFAIAKALDFEWNEPAEHGQHAKAEASLIPVYDISASAGYGALVDSETIVDRLAFPPHYLQQITSSNARHLAIISVKGDSMTPTLSPEDLVMVDTSKRDLSFDGIFVVKDDGASLLVKRIARGSRRGYISMVSDNKSYPPAERALADIECVGKVVWMGVKV